MSAPDMLHGERRKTLTPKDLTSVDAPLGLPSTSKQHRTFRITKAANIHHQAFAF